MDDDGTWQRLLRDALATYALPPEQQLAANGPGCIVCDMSEAFYHAHQFALESSPALPVLQREALARIDASIRGLRGADAECGNNDVVRRPAWQALRQMAAEALETFGWKETSVQPSVEIQPGVWGRPLAEAKPSRRA